jgi:hypothetical protein
MVNQIEIFGLNVYMHEGFDCNDVHLESKNLTGDFRQVVGLISTSGPSAFESIATLSDLYEEVKITWEVLKAQLIMNKKARVPHHKLSLPWHFFVVNDHNKPNPILPQIMHCVICHFVC